MVYLSRIYTRSGDTGETSLGNGERVPKTDLRINAYGTVDELNAVLGWAMVGMDDGSLSASLQHVQNDLFDLGADLCVPEPGQNDAPPEFPPLRIVGEQVEKLERWIDSVTARLQPLESFILPGGHETAARLHIARTVCRRAEIAVLHLAKTEKVNPHIVCYLNRLSDLLFVAARLCNNDGRDDILWVPGQNRQETNLNENPTD
mgnify:FL=1